MYEALDPFLWFFVFVVIVVVVVVFFLRLKDHVFTGLETNFFA